MPGSTAALLLEECHEPRFAAAFAREIAHQAQMTPGRTVSSIFLGGGTPSLMQPATVGAILDSIAAHWSVAPDVEVTLDDVWRFEGPARERGEFYLRQVTGSVNYHTGSEVGDFLQGFLNYHIEHHMFPMVPYHALPRLHEVIKDDLPPPNTSILQAYAEHKVVMALVARACMAEAGW
jgi:hypothetical protein